MLIEGMPISLKELVVSGSKALEIGEALTATSIKILQLLSEEKLDVSTIGRRLSLSEAYISEQIRLMEELNLISVNYEKGKRGIRKVCSTAVDRITLLLKNIPDY